MRRIAASTLTARAQRTALGLATTWVVPSNSTQPQRGVNQQLRPPGLTFEEKRQAAIDALLQFNIMVNQGIKANVTMYTSLIAKMGAGGLEWQAYKLFSRMLDEGIMPLPETYVALKRATSPSRAKLIHKINAKIRDHVNDYPKELVGIEKKLIAEENAAVEQQFDLLMNPTASGSTAGSSGQPLKLSDMLKSNFVEASSQKGVGVGPSAQQSAGRNPTSPDSPQQSYSTMHIANPADVWQVHSRQIEDARAPPSVEKAGNPDVIAEMRAELTKLHEEELRILLTIKKQLRHGSKDDLIKRVLQTCPEGDLRAVLQRRKKYFKAVRTELELQIEAMKSQEGNGIGRGDEDEIDPESELSPDALFDSLGPEGEMSLARNDGISVTTFADTGKAVSTDLAAPTGAPKPTGTEMNEFEAFRNSPDALITPWGILKKPVGQPAIPHFRNPDRDVELSKDELTELYEKARSNELDLVAPRLLRLYARQHVLHWRRREQTSLLEAVQWHILTFPPEWVAPEVAKVARETLEREGVAKTLGTFEALKLFARRCSNLQVVDAVEIIRATKRSQKALRYNQKMELRNQRYANNLETAQALRESAVQYQPPLHSLVDDGKRGHSRILGLTTEVDKLLEEDLSRQPLLSGSAPEEAAGTPVVGKELPPWAVRLKKNPLELRSGQFGSPNVGEFVEKAPGKFGVVGNTEALDRYHVDLETLEPEMRHSIRGQIDKAHRAEEKEINYTEEREQSFRYRKTRAWKERLHERKETEKRQKQKEEGDGPTPVGKQARMGQLFTSRKVNPKLSFTATKKSF